MRVRLVYVPLSAAILATPLPLFPAWAAQDSQPAAIPGASGKGETLVVTGTRGSRLASRSMAPVNIVSRTAIASTGRPGLRDALVNLEPSFNNTPGYPGQLGFATKTASLRGLGSDETLVLVNGKRRHDMASIFFGGAAQGQSPVDLDMIPTSAIDHIEILKDGAAAQYGSDAIAGVINIILKSNGHGGEAQLQYGQYGSSVGPLGDYGRGGSLQVNQGATLPHGGSLSLSADIVGNDYTNNAGYVPYGTAAKPVLIYPRLANGAVDPREYGDRHRQISGLPEVEKQAFSYNYNQPLADGISLYSFSTYTHRWDRAWAWYRPSNSQQNLIGVYPEGYIPRDVTEDNDFQATFGIKGDDLLGWNWDLSTSYGRDNSWIGVENSINTSLGATSPHDFYLGTLMNAEWTTNFDVRRAIATPLFHFPLAVAAGLEFRHDAFEQDAGDPAAYADGGYVFPASYIFPKGGKSLPGASALGSYSPAQAGWNSRVNGAAYLDLDQRLTRRWEVGLAGRLEDYSDFGTTLSGKVSSRFQIAKGLALRGTVSNGFHAPTLQQQYYRGTTLSYTTLPSNEIVQTLTEYAAVTDPIARAVGATPLKPELSRNYSIGFVATPLSDLEATVDFYRIDISNQIVPITQSGAGVTGTQIMNILHASGAVPDDGRYYAVTYERNAARTRAEGVDIALHYLTRHGRFGVVNWGVETNFSNHSVMAVNPVPGAAGAGVLALPRSSYGNITVAYPRNTTRISAIWNIDDFATTVRVSRYSTTRDYSDRGAAYDDTVAPAFIVDLDLAYRFSNGIKLAVGGNNIFNKRPQVLSPLAQAASPIYQTGPSYSPASIYGAEGGFYYGRLTYDW